MGETMILPIWRRRLANVIAMLNVVAGIVFLLLPAVATTGNTSPNNGVAFAITFLAFESGLSIIPIRYGSPCGRSTGFITLTISLLLIVAITFLLIRNS
jgi:drug/metabolite transporter (DMT)-like permease